MNRRIPSPTQFLNRELEILERKVPGAGESLSREVVGFVQRLRGMDLFKLPGIAETIDWTEALIQLDKVALDPRAIEDTLGVLLKYQDDIAKIRGSEAAQLLDQVKAEAAAAQESPSPQPSPRMRGEGGVRAAGEPAPDLIRG